MFKDSLQKRLEYMERENPSLNEHPQNFLKDLYDRARLFVRYIRDNVERHTWTWEDLGIPPSTVEQLYHAGKSGVELEEPPEYLIERTVKATMEACNSDHK